MFRQSSQAKFLTATTTRRSYYHLTKLEVDCHSPKEFIAARAVKPLEGDNLRPYYMMNLLNTLT